MQQAGNDSAIRLAGLAAQQYYYKQQHMSTKRRELMTKYHHRSVWGFQFLSGEYVLPSRRVRNGQLSIVDIRYVRNKNWNDGQMPLQKKG